MDFQSVFKYLLRVSFVERSAKPKKSLPVIQLEIWDVGSSFNPREHKFENPVINYYMTYYYYGMEPSRGASTLSCLFTHVLSFYLHNP